MGIVSHLVFKNLPKPLAYPPIIRSKKGSVRVYIQFLCSRLLRILVASMGVKVSATIEDMPTDPAITILNSLNKRPVIPSMNTIGRKTAISVMVVEITAKKISLEPSIPASLGDMPLSIRI